MDERHLPTEVLARFSCGRREIARGSVSTISSSGPESIVSDWRENLLIRLQTKRRFLLGGHADA